jgi:type VI secretion system protein VasG
VPDGPPNPEGGPASPAAGEPTSELDELKALASLRELQGEAPMVPLQVDGHVVAEIIAAWTGIPVGKMVKDEIRTVRNLQPLLQERVIGQTTRSPRSPSGCARPAPTWKTPTSRRACSCSSAESGVGKTETALALADILYGGERKLITINMSEYQEAHSVSGLKGSPPGLRGLRRGRRADRGGAPQALQRGAAGRGREGPPGRAGAVLPGLRQGRCSTTPKAARSTSATP